jgi:hypothetical protein
MTQDQIDGLISELEHEARQPINTPHMTDLMLKAGNALRESVCLRNAMSTPDELQRLYNAAKLTLSQITENAWDIYEDIPMDFDIVERVKELRGQVQMLTRASNVERAFGEQQAKSLRETLEVLERVRAERDVWEQRHKMQRSEIAALRAGKEWNP